MFYTSSSAKESISTQSEKKENIQDINKTSSKRLAVLKVNILERFGGAKENENQCKR
jgi:hypothetical protein